MLAEANVPRVISVDYCKLKQIVALVTGTLLDVVSFWSRLIGLRYVVIILENMLFFIPNHK